MRSEHLNPILSSESQSQVTVSLADFPNIALSANYLGTNPKVYNGI
jgi:hypothetical protein